MLDLSLKELRTIAKIKDKLLSVPDKSKQIKN